MLDFTISLSNLSQGNFLQALAGQRPNIDRRHFNQHRALSRIHLRSTSTSTILMPSGDKI